MTWTVPSNTYPYGYNPDGNGVQGMGTMLNMKQYELKKTVYNLNPEFWRRYRALMEYALTQGIHLGVGTGWRIQPNPPPPGFAPPGRSNHEGFPADGKSPGAVAIDAVCQPAFKFMELNLKAYGLRSFIQPSTTGYKGSNEPWHVQPAEIPAARKYDNTPWELKEFKLPGKSEPEPEERTVTDEEIERIAQRAADLVWAEMFSTANQGAKPAGWILGQNYSLTQRAVKASEEAAANTRD